MLRSLILGVLFVTTCSFVVANRYNGSHSAHFDGRNFFNPHPDLGPKKGLFTYLWMRLTTDAPEWPKVYPPVEKLKNIDKKVENGVRIVSINHSSFLIQMNGLNILTDPIWSERCSPVSFAGPKRVIDPGINFEDLPPIDVVFISHDHYDHLDEETILRLEREHSPQFIVGLGVDSYFRDWGIKKVQALDWWESLNVDGVQFTFTPAQHWSGRGLFDRRLTLWGGLLLKGEKTLFFAGDSGYSDHFSLIKQRLGKVDIALLPIGAYEPRYFMKYNHMNPKDAALAYLDLGASYLIPIHFGTFRLSNEAYEDPINDLTTAQGELKISKDAIITLRNGNSHYFDK